MPIGVAAWAMVWRQVAASVIWICAKVAGEGGQGQYDGHTEPFFRQSRLCDRPLVHRVLSVFWDLGARSLPSRRTPQKTPKSTQELGFLCLSTTSKSSKQFPQKREF